MDRVAAAAGVLARYQRLFPLVRVLGSISFISRLRLTRLCMRRLQLSFCMICSAKFQSNDVSRCAFHRKSMLEAILGYVLRRKSGSHVLYLACWEISIFFTCFLREAPYLAIVSVHTFSATRVAVFAQFGGTEWERELRT